MKRSILAAAALAAAAAGAWQQAPGMKTVWGEKVTPENAWREYPRPQMARDAWTNLNGLWQYAVTRDALEKGADLNALLQIPARERIGRAKMTAEAEVAAAYAKIDEDVRTQTEEIVLGGEEE